MRRRTNSSATSREEMYIDPTELVGDFRKIAALAGARIARNAVSIELLPAPHSPPSCLPNGKMAVYVFTWKGRCLKVGKAGPRSKARYCRQHYIAGSSKSNLAKSIIACATEMGLPEMSSEEARQWIKENVDRVNLLMDAQHGMPLLTFLESFMQLRLLPKFEGFKSQR